jgi:hypothetical protein
VPTPAECLASLHGKGIRLWVQNGELRYHAKKGTLSSDDLAHLRLLKDGIVAELNKTPAAGSRPLFSRHPSCEQAPLTFQQQWLLELAKRYPNWNGTLAYAFKLTGALNSQLLERSIEEVLRRHGALRTRIIDLDGVPKQQIDDVREYHLIATTAAGDSRAEMEDGVRRLIHDLAARRINAVVGPLFEVRLIDVSDREHFLVVVIHRLAADCLSVSQVFRELWLLYGESPQGRRSQLAQNPMQYGEYAVWQQATDADWCKRHAAYWNDRLAKATGIQWPPEALATGDGRDTLGVLECSFGEALSNGLRELGRQSRTISAMVMLTVYVAILWRWSGQRDFVVPFNIVGRHSEHESVVGYFSHALYLRMQPTGSETFADLLHLVSNEFYRAVSHQDFGRAAVAIPEILRGTFFQWLAWHPDDMSGLTKSAFADSLGFTLENIHVQKPGDLTTLPPGAVDIEMSFFERANGICASATYRADRFAPQTMERFIADLRVSAEQFVCNPRTPVLS